jgi:hypothetical protein
MVRNRRFVSQPYGKRLAVTTIRRPRARDVLSGTSRFNLAHVMQVLVATMNVHQSLGHIRASSPTLLEQSKFSYPPDAHR